MEPRGMNDPRFKTERERRFYYVYWVLLWLIGIVVVIIGLCRLFTVGGKVPWAIISTGIAVPLCHTAYEWLGLVLSKIGIALYEWFKSRA